MQCVYLHLPNCLRGMLHSQMLWCPMSLDTYQQNVFKVVSEAMSKSFMRQYRLRTLHIQFAAAQNSFLRILGLPDGHKDMINFSHKVPFTFSSLSLFDYNFNSISIHAPDLVEYTQAHHITFGIRPSISRGGTN